MPSTDARTPLPNGSTTGSRNKVDQGLIWLMSGFAVAVSLFLFFLCGGIWVLAFIAFAWVLWKWGEDHILPWMFALSVFGGAVCLVAYLLGTPL